MSKRAAARASLSNRNENAPSSTSKRAAKPPAKAAKVTRIAAKPKAKPNNQPNTKLDTKPNAKAFTRPAAKPALKSEPASKVAKKSKPKTAKSLGSTSQAVSRPFCIVDAFASRPGTGNPAAVVLVEGGYPEDEQLQQIAAEFNLSETAFVLATGQKHKGLPLMGLRWFTPTMEIDLCGHATMAAMHALQAGVGMKNDAVIFDTRSGKLPVTRQGQLITLDFPAIIGNQIKVSSAMSAAIGCPVEEAYLARDLMLVVDNRRYVYEIKPDFAAMMTLPGMGVAVTAPGSGHDFVSRCFFPKSGVNEDPVTGSAHCMMAPFWSVLLRRKNLSAHQVSKRGGEILLEVRDDRVLLSGHAVLVAVGTLMM